MKTVTLNIFKFDELSETAKNKAVESFRESMEYNDECVFENLTDLLVAIGFDEDVEIEYSLDYSHIPFANVVSGGFNKKDLTKARKNYGGEKVVELFDLIENSEIERTDLLEAINKFVFSMIESDFEYYYSTESIIEEIEALEMDFFENGTSF